MVSNSLKNITQNVNHFARDRGENKAKFLSCHQLIRLNIVGKYLKPTKYPLKLVKVYGKLQCLTPPPWVILSQGAMPRSQFKKGEMLASSSIPQLPEVQDGSIIQKQKHVQNIQKTWFSYKMYNKSNIINVILYYIGTRLARVCDEYTVIPSL